MLRAYDEPDPAAAFFDTIGQKQTTDQRSH
jgi:hypothetical protein